MSSIIPPSLEGTQAPNTIEILWEKHRRKVNAFAWILVLGLAAYYGYRYYRQSEINKEWSSFALSTFLDSGYSPEQADARMARPIDSDLFERLEKSKLEELERGLASSSKVQRPYLMWLIANKAVMEKEWGTAEKYLGDLESEFPTHALCEQTEHPVQIREPEKTTEATADVGKGEEPKLKPAKPGSMVSRLRDQIAAAKTFALPASFAKPEIPAGAPRYKIALSGGRGEFVVALLCDQAPKHCAEFDKLVQEKFWDGIKIDEINRPAKNQPAWFSFTQFHFGFPITKTESDRTKWDTSKPSEHVVDEVTGLSHFEGAIAARSDSDGKSSIDRIWVCAADTASQDGFRQVFGYVVEGLEVVKAVCETDLSNSNEEQIGRGKPAENVTIESVTRM